jgi:UDP-N-acetylmuramate--alanine ligase
MKSDPEFSNINSNTDPSGAAFTLPSPGSKIHFIGICGSSMSGLALLIRHYGYIVSGSDKDDNPVAVDMRSKGIKVIIGQKAENIDDSISLVVYTVAVKQDNPELKAVIDRGIPLIERGSFLGIISRKYKYPVSVSGAHGKTTTTAMLSSIMLSAGYDPAIHLGGVFPLIGGSVRPSESNYFITEACEYYEHMLKLSSYGAIILNVDSEHLDYYKNDANIDAAFAKFASNVSSDGFLVVCAENERAMYAASPVSARVVTYALSSSSLNAEFEADNICAYPDRTEFDLLHNSVFCERVVIHIPGSHYVLDSLAASAAAWNLGADEAAIKTGLDAFTGTGRRFEHKGTVRGAKLIDDYAHHPAEVKATLSAARTAAGEEGRIIAIFQVHTYTRAIDFGASFAEALKEADDIVVSDIYAARETDPGTVSGRTLTDLFVRSGLNARYISGFEQIAEYVSSVMRSGDIVITLGAGDINKVIKLIK